MLVHDDGDGVVCIGQAAHSWVSGQLVRRWQPEPAPLAAVCLGAEQHDIGMAEWDRRPELHPETGFPRSFLDLPLDTHLELWTDAPHRLETQSPYAALLVSMHGAELFRTKRESTPAIEAYLAGQADFQAGLIAALGEDPARARRNQQLIWAVDHLALVGLIPRWAPTDLSVGIHVEAEPGRVTVDPWPFDTGEITIGYPGRRLTAPSQTTEELHERLAAAPWVEVPVTWAGR